MIIGVIYDIERKSHRRGRKGGERKEGSNIEGRGEGLQHKRGGKDRSHIRGERMRAK